MKLKLLCRKEMKEQLLDDLQKGQVTVCEDADYVLYEANYDYRYLLVRDHEEYMRLAVEDIIYIESRKYGYIPWTAGTVLKKQCISWRPICMKKDF